MSAPKEILNLKLDEFDKQGLYLIFPDSTRVDLVTENIEHMAERYWSDPSKISPEIKKAAEFQPCKHCPNYGKDVLCKALTPLLPYIDSLDKYMSYANVTAVFRGKDSQLLHVSQTTLQRALCFLPILSMIFYCEMSERYSKYFTDIMPLMDIRSISSRIYSNIYIKNKGDQAAISSIITQLKSEVTESTHCLLKRLRMICKRDAFANAFVHTHLIFDCLDSNKKD